MAIKKKSFWYNCSCQILFSISATTAVANYGKCSFATGSLLCMRNFLPTFLKLCSYKLSYLFRTKIVTAKNTSFLFLQNTIFHEQVFLNTTLKLMIIRILCTIPSCMIHGLYSQTHKTHMCVTVETLDQYWIKINIKKNYMNWLHMKLTSFLKISLIDNVCWYNMVYCVNFLEYNICNFLYEIPKRSDKQHISIKTDALRNNKEWQNNIRGKVH